jgi:hypothetical protein
MAWNQNFKVTHITERQNIMTEDFFDFGTTTDNIVEPSPDPWAQWFHRRNFVDANGKAKGMTVGWHSEQGLCEEWDMACAVAGLRTIHLKQGGKIVPYWQLGSNSMNEDDWGTASPFILAKGCPSEWDMRSSKTERYGIAYGWGAEQRKSLKFRAFLPEIYDRPVVFVANGMGLVDCMLQALGKDGHYKVLRANNARLAAKGLTTKTPYWGFRLTLMPGDDIDIKGKKGSSEITAIVTDIPKEITGEYLAAHHVGQYRELVQKEIKESDHSIAWSLRVSQEIAAGSETPEARHGEGEEASAIPGVDNDQLKEELLIAKWALAYKIPDNEISTRWMRFVAWVFGKQVTELTGEHKAALYNKIQQQLRKSAS